MIMSQQIHIQGWEVLSVMREHTLLSWSCIDNYQWCSHNFKVFMARIELKVEIRNSFIAQFFPELFKDPLHGWISKSFWSKKFIFEIFLNFYLLEKNDKRKHRDPPLASLFCKCLQQWNWARLKPWTHSRSPRRVTTTHVRAWASLASQGHFAGSRMGGGARTPAQALQYGRWTSPAAAQLHFHHFFEVLLYYLFTEETDVCLLITYFYNLDTAFSYNSKSYTFSVAKWTDYLNDLSVFKCIVLKNRQLHK